MYELIVWSAMLGSRNSASHFYDNLSNKLLAVSDSEDEVDNLLKDSIKAKQKPKNKPPFTRSTSAEELIEESKQLLHRHSSELTFDGENIVLEEDKNKKTKREQRPSLAGNMVSKVCMKSSPRPQGILGTKHIRDGLPIIKQMKKKKAVHFNMDKNETCEIVQPEMTRPNSDTDDEEESEDESLYNKDKNNNSIFGQVMDAGELGMSDDEEDNGKVQKSIYDGEKRTNGYHNVEKDLMKNEINDLTKEKTNLLAELKQLRKRHDKEMKQLREEYQLRREDYYTELDEVQGEINEKKNELFGRKKGRDGDLSPLREQVESEKEKLDNQKKDLQRRQAEVAEQEQELKEYQRYLDRRHKSLNEKEEDLCMLQDELEELDDVLKAKKKQMSSEKERLEINKQCTHDGKQIEQTRLELIESSKTEAELRERLKVKENEAKEQQEKIKTIEEENNKLHSKVKNLETQVTLALKSSVAGSLAERRSSMRTLGTTIPVNKKTGELVSPRVVLLSPTLSRAAASLSPKTNRRLSKSPNDGKISDSEISPLTPRDLMIQRTNSRENSDLVKSHYNELSNDNEAMHTDSTSVQSKTCAIM